MPYTKLSCWCFQLEHYMEKLLHSNFIISYFVRLMQKRIHFVILYFQANCQAERINNCTTWQPKWIWIYYNPTKKKWGQFLLSIFRQHSWIFVHVDKKKHKHFTQAHRNYHLFNGTAIYLEHWNMIQRIDYVIKIESRSQQMVF